MARLVPVLEVGGTHVTAALVEPSRWTVTAEVRRAVDGDAAAAEILDQFVATARELTVPSGTDWGVAMPDPFDYERGVGRFTGVGKFAALNGVDLRTPLELALGGRLRFLNDADAFALGEWTAGAAVGAARCVGITLGTGIGSGWLVDGRVVDPGDPPGGRVHTVTVDGLPLEERVSRRAIRRAFAADGGAPAADVREITALARGGDERAARVLDAAMGVLGEALAPRLRMFGPDTVVVGGSMSASWDILGPPLRARLRTAARVVVADEPEDAPLIGAAQLVTRQ
jgi:glucokinase